MGMTNPQKDNCGAMRGSIKEDPVVSQGRLPGRDGWMEVSQMGVENGGHLGQRVLNKQDEKLHGLCRQQSTKCEPS